MPFLSIIIPLYNSEKTICNCIDSILKQTLTDFEIIVVDDGSTDNSVEIIRKRYKNEDRITVILQPNSGPLKARSNGIKKSSGKYIAFIDSDDTIEPNLYETVFKDFKGQEPDAICLSSYTVKKADILANRYISNSEAVSLLLKFEYPTSMWANIYRSDIAKSIQIDDPIFFLEDALFNYLYLKKSSKIWLSDCNLYNYSDSPNSLSKMVLSERRASSLIVADKIFNDTCYGELQYEKLFFYCHILVSLITSFVFPKRNTKKIVKEVQQRCRKIRNGLKENPIVPHNYKRILLMASMFPSILCILATFRRKKTQSCLSRGAK